MTRASLKEATGRPPNRLTRSASACNRKAGEWMQEMTCDAVKGGGLHFSTFTTDQCVGGLIPQDCPQDAVGLTSGGHAGNGRRFSGLELLVIAAQDGLVQDEGCHSAHQGTAGIDI